MGIRFCGFAVGSAGWVSVGGHGTEPIPEPDPPRPRPPAALTTHRRPGRREIMTEIDKSPSQ